MDLETWKHTEAEGEGLLQLLNLASKLALRRRLSTTCQHAGCTPATGHQGARYIFCMRGLIVQGAAHQHAAAL